MKKIFLILTVCAGMSLAFAVPPGDTTLEGNYIWTRRPDESGPVKAVFKPAEKGFAVSFHFKFEGKDFVYSGMAEGSLESGALKGEVQNEAKNRTFNFEGTVENGVFTGTHSESRRGKVIDTGTITLTKK